MPFDFRKELSNIVAAMAHSGAHARLLDDNEARQVVVHAREVFVIGNPRAWWMNLRQVAKRIAFPNNGAIEHVKEFFPDDYVSHFLILETGDEPMPVVQAELRFIPRIVKELPFIEYYLLDCRFQHLFIEDDHGMIHVVNSEGEN